MAFSPIKKKRLIILDRDGVINRDSPNFIKSPEEWFPIDGSLQAIATLKALGYLVVVATNQSGVGRGLFSLDILHAIHQKMHNALAAHCSTFDAIYFCPHGPDDGCGCRKPKPGMLLTALQDFQCDPSQAILIGDSPRDIEAAQSAGCEAALVLTGKGRGSVGQVNAPVFADLASWVASLSNKLFCKEVVKLEVN